MPQVSTRDQLKKLIELQTIDTEIYQLKDQLREKPIFLENLKSRFEEKKTELKSLEERLKNIQVGRKSKELDLQAKEGDISKANSQLSLLKTNREYTARLTEIESLKADKSIIEEKILILYDEGDHVAAAIAKEKAALAQEEKKYLDNKKEIDELILVIEDRLKVLAMKHEQASVDVDRTNLKRYERIVENKKGLAIVPIRNNSCGGCFMNVPEQVINEIKMHDKILCCEMCARIFYLEDEL